MLLIGRNKEDVEAIFYGAENLSKTYEVPQLNYLGSHNCLTVAERVPSLIYDLPFIPLPLAL
ncbi:hypothetical protein N482_00315 [Pseudoalteromonas luteoviolacea NCIMB 1942]|uniref:Uncharacterized protein n=1 Tax=Pseudoalteromonas luteoviolacea NCIMB 1942 TaxID=1365253 RepID=A0A167I3W9_9GAMM|nr:hypothetical protein N482_00315 [Pseudoalteromonas luteoviolacea NCIMB 1942]